MVPRKYEIRFFSLRFLLLLLLIPAAHAKDYYVSPDGLSNADGSIDRPWTLNKAMAGQGIQPGDVIWLRGGLYRGAFTSRLIGSSTLPIVVRGYPGERATLDGAGQDWQKAVLRIEGSWVWFRDFEITNSNTYTFNIARSRGIDDYAPHSKLINLVIHNTGQGIGFWTQAVDSEAYGCIIYANGHLASDRGHGHGIYTQNMTGLKQVRDNILFNQFGYNFHAYGTASAGLRNYVVSGNVSFNGTFLVGGDAPAEDVSITDNSFYRSTVQFGYGNRNNRNLTFTNNLVGGFVSAQWWDHAVIRKNIMVPVDETGQDHLLSVYLRTSGVTTDYDIDENQYYRGPKRDGWQFFLDRGPKQENLLFPGWQKVGYDTAGSYTANSNYRPVENTVILKVNEYAPDRAQVTVFNWKKLDSVEVDLSPLKLAPGDRYEVRNVQNYYGEAVSGVYTGAPVSIPMNSWTATSAIDMYYRDTDTTKVVPLAQTFPEFGVFIVSRADAKHLIRPPVSPARRK